SARRRPANLVLSLPSGRSGSTSTGPSSAFPLSNPAPLSAALSSLVPVTAAFPPSSLSLNSAFPVSPSRYSPTPDNSDPNRPPAYANGPVEVYGSNIYLFSEPTRSVAAQFDVVINVAREVINPFLGSDPSSCLLPSSLPAIIDSPAISCPQTIKAIPPHEQLLSPGSPSHSPQPTQVPEYISVPWDHGSKLTSDLPYLTSFMALRSSQGKRVLVHCQCGVSRSATLLVAFVMKENGWDVNRAYTWVKSKAPAIGPNMGLIYQLMEWSKILNTDQQLDSSVFREEDE
ncbi:dual specificity phosphatase, partial [Lipomyces oligophaga]|uniref:dual specificity phosphatase n=1 Tax=Lipomyces oligophaga TaxID=45792 RepID=UPI0034CFEA46